MSLSIQRIAIKLNKAAEKHVRKGHPWIYEDSIAKQSKAGDAGNLAIIFDQNKNQFLACGLFDPASFIRIKVLEKRKNTPIDKHWFKETFQLALEKRSALRTEQNNSFRWIYGEADKLPHLILDAYAQVLVLKLYSSIWIPYLAIIKEVLSEYSWIKGIVLRMSRQLANQLDNIQEGNLLYGELENESVVFLEQGVKFLANVVQGHKTGYFMDHRHNRIDVASLAKDKTILDVFSYNGGFSIHALAQGAKHATMLDISKKALEDGKANAMLNGLEERLSCLAGDAFKMLGQLRTEQKKYDIVVVDPPSLAKQKSEVDVALKQYAKLARLASKLVSPNGLLVLASCSSRVSAEVFFETIETALDKTNKRLLKKTYHDIDHPITFQEGAYLKCVYYRLD